MNEGDTAPPIHLQTDSGAEFDLGSLKGKKVVLYFFPKANTPGWTVEASEFRDAIKQFQKRNTEVVGISPDPPEAQAAFKQKHGLPFTLLCDVEKSVAQAFGVWKEKNMYGKKVMGVERTTFVIDEKGKIAKIFPKVKPEGHAAQVLAVL